LFSWPAFRRVFEFVQRHSDCSQKLWWYRCFTWTIIDFLVLLRSERSWLLRHYSSLDRQNCTFRSWTRLGIQTLDDHQIEIVNQEPIQNGWSAVYSSATKISVRNQAKQNISIFRIRHRFFHAGSWARINVFERIQYWQISVMAFDMQFKSNQDSRWNWID